MATLRVCSQVQEVHAAVKGDYESNEQQLRNIERVRAEGTPAVHHCAYFAVPLPCASCHGPRHCEIWTYPVQDMSACGFCACIAPWLTWLHSAASDWQLYIHLPV